MKPHLTQNNSFCLRSKPRTQAFNLSYVYSYDFLSFFSKRVIGVLLVARKAAEEAGEWKKIQWSVFGSHNWQQQSKFGAADTCFFLQKSLFFLLIPSFQFIDICTRSALNVTILLFAFCNLPETIAFLSFMLG